MLVSPATETPMILKEIHAQSRIMVCSATDTTDIQAPQDELLLADRWVQVTDLMLMSLSLLCIAD